MQMLRHKVGLHKFSMKWKV